MINFITVNIIYIEVAIPTISLAVTLLFMARGSGQDASRAVALLCHRYCGHPFGKDENIKKERESSRLTKIWIGLTLPGARPGS